MYNLIKKNLLILAILALPVMNNVVMADKDEDPTANTCRTIVVKEEQKEEESCTTQLTSSANTTADILKIGMDVCVWEPLKNVGYLAETFAGASLPVKVVTFCGAVALAAEACLCYCWPDLNSPPYPTMIGERDPMACKNECYGKNYFKNITCN